MKQNPSFGVIGMGNMAAAILSRAIETKFLSSKQIIASEIDTIRCDHIKKILDIECDHSLEKICSCNVVMIAVKPQNLPELLEKMKNHITDNTLVLSIVTGYTTKCLFQKLSSKGHIIRIMPNTPVTVGEGMCALCKGPNSTKEDMDFAFDLFSSLGAALIISEEKMDIVASLSGSGPAYFFYIVESFIKTGIEKGLSQEEASQLAIATINGSAKMLQKTRDPVALRQEVTSPGGSTAEAIKILQDFDFEKIFSKAFQAAIDKNIELGK